MKKTLFWTGSVCFAALASGGSLVFNPGDGVTTNVTEILGGNYDSIQINPGTSGGIVNFLNTLSYFSGAPVVNRGTMSVGDLRPLGHPSALGRGSAGDVITVKDGTFHYAGSPAETDRGLVISASATNSAAVLSVADGTSLKLTGSFKTESGVIVKRGGGTLILAPQATSVSNCFATADLTASVLPDFNDNGDSPTTGFGSLTVFDGRLVIDTPDTATNYFHVGDKSTGYVGLRSTDTGPETEAHIEFRGGINELPNDMYVGYQAGNTTTAGTTLHHSFNVYGGLVNNYKTDTAFYLGHSTGMNNNSVSHLNIYGGELRTFYFRPGQTLGNVSRTFVSGGTLFCYGVYSGHYSAVQSWDDENVEYIPDIDIHVTSNGMMHVNGGPFYICRDGLVKQTVRVTDGGTLRFSGFTSEVVDAVKGKGRLTFLVDGGNILTLDKDSELLPGVTTKIGEKGMMWKNNRMFTITGPIVSADNVTEDGGIELSGSGTVKFFGETSFNGPLIVKETHNIAVSNKLSALYVQMADGFITATGDKAVLNHLKHSASIGRIDATPQGGAVPKLTLLGWDAPSLLSVKCSSVPATGSYTILEFPSSVAFSDSRIVLEGTVSEGKSILFSVETAGTVSRIVMNVSNVSVVTGTDYSWNASAGGNWSDASNWSGSSAPGENDFANVTFAAAPSSDPATVTLDTAANVTSLAFDANPGYRISGSGSIALGANNSTVTITAAGAATNHIDVPVTATGLVKFDIPKKGRVNFASVSGNANLKMACSTINGGSGFGGTVRIDSLDGFKGSLDFPSGLISVGTVPEGLNGLKFGYGEFRYTGSEDVTIDCPVTLTTDAYSEARLGVENSDTVFTLSGSIKQEKGGFWKMGQGTLVLTGAFDYNFGLDVASYGDPPANVPMGWDSARNEWIWDSNGRALTYNSCMVAGGKMIWGGVAGQTMKIGNLGFTIGGITTSLPGMEYDAEAQILGGTTTVDGPVYITLNHGNKTYSTAAKERLSAKLSISGGTFTAPNLIMAYNYRNVSTTDSFYEQTGGDVNITSKTIVGNKAKDSTASFTLSGGTFTTPLFSVCEAKPAPYTDITLSGGVLTATSELRFLEGTNTFYVLEGGALRSGKIYKGGNSKTVLCFNGGTLKPTCMPDGTFGRMFGFPTISIGEKGMIVDLSDLKEKYFTIESSIIKAEGVETDGGITVRGGSEYNPASLSFTHVGTNYFNGPIVVENGGNVSAYFYSLTNNTVLVKNGGAFGPRWTSDQRPYNMASLTLGESSADTVIFQVETALPSYEKAYAGKILVRDSFTLNGNVALTFVNINHNALLAPEGTYTILIAPKGSIDPAKFSAASFGPAMSADFTVSSYDADYDQLSVTIGSTIGSEHVWTSASSGSWTDSANWSLLPQDKWYDGIVFPATLETDITVAMNGDRTLGAISHNAETTVKLTGGKLDFPTSSASISTVSNGVLELPAITATDVVNVNPSANSGKVKLAEGTSDVSFNVTGGTLEGSIGNFGSGDITVQNGTLSMTGSGIVNTPVIGKGMILRTEGDTFFMQDVYSDTGVFVKAGPGTAYLCGSGEVWLGRGHGDSTKISGGTSAMTHLPDNGDLPSASLGGAINIVAGKLVVGLDPNQTINTTGSRLDIGQSFFEQDENGDILPSEFEMLGGKVTINSDLNLGRNPGMYAYKYSSLASKRRDLKFTMWDGEFTCNSMYMQWDPRYTLNGNAIINIHGGSMTIKNEYIAFGYNYRAGNTNIVNIYNGSMSLLTTVWETGPISGNFNLNLYGGTFSTVLPFLNKGAANTVNYNFAGGTLTMPYLYRVNSGTIENLIWDGGVYKPTSNDCALVGSHLAWTKNECRAGGAKFDLSGITAASPVFICDQAFTHQSSLSGEDGGVEMLGGGTLVLSEVNSMNGPVTVSGGTVKATVSGAVPSLVLGASGAFDGYALKHSITYLKGAGGLAANGTLEVAGSMSALSDDLTDAPYVVVTDISFGSGCLVKCPLTVNGDSLAAPYFRVTSSCKGVVRLDFGRNSANPVPDRMRVKVAECAAGVTPPAVRGFNTGLEKRYFVASETVVNSTTGLVDVYAVLKPVGTVIIMK